MTHTPTDLNEEQLATQVWDSVKDQFLSALDLKLERQFYIVDVSDADIPELKAHNEKLAEILKSKGINILADNIAVEAAMLLNDKLLSANISKILSLNNTELIIDGLKNEIAIKTNDASIVIGNDGLTITKADNTLFKISGSNIEIVNASTEDDPMPCIELPEAADPVDVSHYTLEQQEMLRPYQKILKGLDVAEVAVAINARAGKVVTPGDVSLSGIKFQLDLIKDELDEAYEALAKIKVGYSATPENKAALNEFLDAAIGDVLLCTLGLGARLPINPIQEYLNVCLTNLTRIPQSQEEAEATVEKFRKLNVKTEIRSGTNPDGTLTYPVLTPADGKVQQGLDGRTYQSNYFCKGVNTFLPTAYGLTEEVIFVE